MFYDIYSHVMQVCFFCLQILNISEIYRINIITRITNKFASRGLLQKNIYIYMDEYIDNLHTLKKHLQFHFKDIRQLLLLNQLMIECLNKFLD